MFDFIIEENKYNTLTWKCDNILRKYIGPDEIVYVPDGINIIADAFSNNTSIKKVVLSNTITAIDCYAFQNCTKLEEVVFSNNITIIRPFAFSNCTSLKVLNFPDSLINLESKVISFKNLEKVRFPKRFTTNEVGFCPKLKEIVYSADVKSVVINKCDGLTELSLPDNVETLTLYNCNNIENIKFSSKLVACSIKDCNGIKDIILPEGICRLGIENCGSLENIYIPESVNYLGSDIFKGVKDGLNISYGGSFEDWQKLIKDRETYEKNGPNQNQYHYLGELSWIMYAPETKIETVIHGGFKYNLKCNK